MSPDVTPWQEAVEPMEKLGAASEKVLHPGDHLSYVHAAAK
jgi:hypothetical protein